MTRKSPCVEILGRKSLNYIIRVRCQEAIEKNPYGHVLIHDRTAAKIAVIEVDYAQWLRSIPKANVISYNPRKMMRE
jgi:hypothetical protein